MKQLRAVAHRVDALTLAYRVRLSPSFVEALRERSRVAREHGRAAFSFSVRAPDDDGDGTIAKLRHVGPLRMRWSDEADRVNLVSKLWGELRYSTNEKAWKVVNDPFYQIVIRLYAPGGGEIVDCSACGGRGSTKRPGVSTIEPCTMCDCKGRIEEPGFTIEVTWRAQTLADWGLDVTLRESAALASMCGDVLETRLRRIDLCADIQGWKVSGRDVRRLAKRPRAEWGVYDDGLRPDDPDEHPARRSKPFDEGVNVYGTGALAKRRVTGIAIGRGGDLSSRIYDKRAELVKDASETTRARREAEEERWRAGGWDGVSPVTRVEFQIRGQALVELGVRDPDVCLEPEMGLREFIDARGSVRKRLVVVGQRALTVTNDNGREEQATLVHRLEDIWRTCLDWVSLVRPERTRNGNEKVVSRLREDRRWELLRTVSFAKVEMPRPIRRYRPRAAASAAQALGVTLSQAGREGRLHELDEAAAAYPNDERGIALLRSRLLALKVLEAERIVTDLVERFGSPAEACRHFAIRSNASRMRFHHGHDALCERGPPSLGRVEIDVPRIKQRKRTAA